jgi:hypothetical protein
MEKKREEKFVGFSCVIPGRLQEFLIDEKADHC